MKGAIKCQKLSRMTNKEKAWINAILELGCIVCLLFRGVRTPAEAHHLLSGGRRLGHLFTIPLCFLHHRSGRNDEEVVSRDHNAKRFEARYGKESWLLEQTKLLIGES